MSARVLDIGENYPGADEHLFFEIRPGEFVLGVSWKAVAQYVAYFENRRATIVTQTQTAIKGQFPKTRDVTDLY